MVSSMKNKRGGARIGSGSPPNFDRTATLLERQIAHVEARHDVPLVELQLQLTRLHVLVNRLHQLVDDVKENRNETGSQ